MTRPTASLPSGLRAAAPIMHLSLHVVLAAPAQLRVWSRYALLGGAVALCHCSPAPAQTPAAAQPVQESLARQWIAEAVSAHGNASTGPRWVSLPRNRKLGIDVGVAGHKYAVAFLIESERQQLGSSVPAHDVGRNALALVRDASDPSVRILVLHDLAYLTDEQRGEERELSSVAVKQRLQRDVRDFLVEAARQGWP